jgi:predicted transposase YdaD
MTLAQKIREEGRVEGLEEGREEGMRHAIWGLLKIRFGAVQEGLREELDHISNMERLETLHRQAVYCASLEEFAAAL